MAIINWQSVAAPQFGQANNQINQGNAGISRGLGELSDIFTQSAAKDKAETKANSIADMHHQLLSLAGKEGVDEKDILAQSLKLGKSLDLTPSEALAQGKEVQSMVGDFSALTTDQEQEFQAMTGQVDAAKQQGAQFLQNKLLEFDQTNPSSYATSLKSQYGEGLSPGQAIEAGTAGLEGNQWFNLLNGETGQDLRTSLADTLKLDAYKDVDGAVVAEAFKRTGVDEGGWLDKDGINMTFFKENLAVINDRFKRENGNLIKRAAKTQLLSSDVSKQVSALQSEALKYYNGARKENKTRSLSQY